MGDWNGIDEVVAVAESGSFVGAGRRLGTSTSNVSRAVARLEQKLSAQLFQRTTRAVSLTDTGRTLVHQFKRIIAERDETFAMVQLESEPQGLLRVTCPMALGERFVAPIVRKFVSAHPKLNVFLDLSDHMKDIVSEGFDLAIRTGALPESSLIRTQIATRRIMTCASPDYIGQHGVPMSLEDLAAHDCLIATNSTWRFHSGGQERSVKPNGRLHCNNGAAVAEAAIAGLGICQLPDFYCADPLGNGTLIRVLEEYESRPEPIWAVYPQRRHLLPKVQKLIERLRRELPGRMNGQQHSGQS